MADGGITVDKSLDPAKMDLREQAASIRSESNSSLTDHLQRLLAVKNSTSTTDNDSIRIEDSEFRSDSMNIEMLLNERDDMWREHERSQIAFMEREHQRMLTGLHLEVERLQAKCSDLTRQYAEALTNAGLTPGFVEKPDRANAQRILDLEEQLELAKEGLISLREHYDRKQEKLASLEKRMLEQQSHYEAELERKKKQIEDVTAELNQKTSLIAQLTVQLHQLRLKEAVEKQRHEQRRHAAEQQTKRCQALANPKSVALPKDFTASGKSIPGTLPKASTTSGESVIGTSQTITKDNMSSQVSKGAASSLSQRSGISKLNSRPILSSVKAVSPAVSRRNVPAPLPAIMTKSTPSTCLPNGKRAQEKKLVSSTSKSQQF